MNLQPITNSPESLESVIERFLRLIPADGAASPRTLVIYRDGIGAWARWCIGRGIEASGATTDDVLAYRQEISQDYSRATVKVRLTCVRMVYTALQRWGMRKDNPAAGIRAPKAPESDATNVLQKSISPDQSAYPLRL